MSNKNAKNCWEYWDCAMSVREICPAYTTDSGRECWMVAGSFNAKGNVSCPKVKKQFKTCLECEWFQKLNPNL